MHLKADHVLVVAGPSGCGKSLFLQQLANQSLAPDLMSHLPAGVTTWPQTSVKQLAKGQAKAEPRQVIHYDIMRPYLLGFQGYQDDGHFQTFLHAGRTDITIVTLQIARDRLRRQYSRRRSLAARIGLGRKLPLANIYSGATGELEVASGVDGLLRFASRHAERYACFG